MFAKYFHKITLNNQYFNKNEKLTNCFFGIFSTRLQIQLKPLGFQWLDLHRNYFDRQFECLPSNQIFHSFLHFLSFVYFCNTVIGYHLNNCCDTPRYVNCNKPSLPQQPQYYIQKFNYYEKETNAGSLAVVAQRRGKVEKGFFDRLSRRFQVAEVMTELDKLQNDSVIGGVDDVPHRLCIGREQWVGWKRI